MFTYNILIYQFEPEPLILRGFPALLIHLSVENGIINRGTSDRQAEAAGRLQLQAFYPLCQLLLIGRAV